MGEVATQEQQAPQARAMVASGGKVEAFIPTDLNGAWRIADIMANSGMVPKAFSGKAEACFVGIMAGAEVGLAPFQALQSIAVINGNPSLWGDGALALVQSSGLLVDMDEVWDADTLTATCSMTRKGRASVITRSFSMEDAKRAGLAGKDTYKSYPQRMCPMRARAWCMRDGFADVLKGLAIAEEVQDIEVEIKPASPSVNISDLRRQAGRTEVEAEPVDQSLADDAEHLKGDLKPEPATVGDIIDQHDADTGEIVEQGRTDEQHGDQQDGSDDGLSEQDRKDGIVADDSNAERATKRLIGLCVRASNRSQFGTVLTRFERDKPALEFDQIERIASEVAASRIRLKIPE